MPLVLLFCSTALLAQYNVSVTVSQVQVTGFCDLDGIFSGDSDAQWVVDVDDNRDYSENFDHEVSSDNGPTVTATGGWDNPLTFNKTYTDICPPNFLITTFEGCEDDDGGQCSGLDDLSFTATANVPVPTSAGTTTTTYTVDVGGCSGTVTFWYTLVVTTTGTPAYFCSDEPCLAEVQTIQDGCTTTAIFETRYDVSNSTSTYPSSLFGGCGGNNDIFFEFVAPTSGEILINMTAYEDFGSLFELVDLTMNLMEGPSCSNLSPVDNETYNSTDVTNASADCIDMSGGVFNDNYTPLYFTNLTPGQTYYIRVTEDDDQNAYMDLSFQAIVENDYCSNAIELTGTDSFTACNFNATDRDEPDSPSWTSADHTGTFGGGAVQTCTSWSSNENMVWYYFTVDSNTPQPISITAESVVCEAGAQTLQLGIWYQGSASACDIGNMQGVGCAVGIGDLTVTLPPAVPNGVYYVGMDGNAGALCTWEFTSDQVLPTCPRQSVATASATSICSGGSMTVDLSYLVPGFGGAEGLFDITASPSTGVSFSSGPIGVSEGIETITFPNNQTCSPRSYTLSFNGRCSNGADIDDPASITVMVYPETMSVVVTDDGSTCGIPTAELRAADGTVCETLSAAACTEGATFDYDFSTTATIAALGTPPAGCALPTSLTGTITCSGCISCSIDNIAAGTQSPCNDDTYNQDVIITFTDAPATGSLNVNGTIVPIGTSPQTVTLSGLVADGNPVSVTATFTDEATCTLTTADVFTAPTPCVVCSIDNITAGTPTPCDDDFYDVDITVTYTDAPSTGSLDVNGTTFAIGSSPQTVTLTGLAADGNPLSITATFTSDAACSLTVADLVQAPASCVSCTDGIQNGLETGLDCGGPNCPACPVCTVSQYYSGAILTGIYQTSSTIGTNALIFSGSDVSLLAGTICMDSNFEVQLGAEFLADPVPCLPLTDNNTTSLQENVITHAFVENTTIVFNYYLPTDGTVSLTIQNLDGSFEENLFNESKLKGEHLAQIIPHTLQSGVYMLVLKTNKGEKIERIVIP